jgi:hypothetical protein
MRRIRLSSALRFLSGVTRSFTQTAELVYPLLKTPSKGVKFCFFASSNGMRLLASSQKLLLEMRSKADAGDDKKAQTNKRATAKS